LDPIDEAVSEIHSKEAPFEVLPDLAGLQINNDLEKEQVICGIDVTFNNNELENENFPKPTPIEECLIVTKMKPNLKLQLKIRYQPKRKIAQKNSDKSSEDASSKLGPIMYDPKDRGCQREGLRIRRYSHPYWINNSMAKYLIVKPQQDSREIFGNMKFDKKLKSSGITPSKFYSEPIFRYLDVKAKEKRLKDLKEKKAQSKKDFRKKVKVHVECA
jgi:hypothetical protein